MTKLIQLLATLAVASVFAGCENARIVQVGHSTYLASASSAAGAFANTSALKAGVIEDANKFAEKRGRVVIPLAVTENQPAIGFPSCNFKFMAVTRDEAQKLAAAQARQREQERKEWASLTPAQRMDFTLREQALQQQQQAMQLNAAEAVDAQSQALSNQTSYDARTRAIQQPVNVNVYHSGYVNHTLNGTIDVYNH